MDPLARRIASQIVLIVLLAVLVEVAFANPLVGVDLSGPRGAVVQIRSGESSCSAVRIAPNTFLSAAHCFGGGDPMKLDGVEVKVLRTDPVKDMAVFTVPKQPCPCIPLADDNPKQDTAVVAVGYPYGFGQIATMGLVQGYGGDLAEFMVSTPNIAPGNSGGGIFARSTDGRWVLVGVVSFGVGVIADSVGNRGPTHIGGAASVRSIKLFLRSLRLAL